MITEAARDAKVGKGEPHVPEVAEQQHRQKDRRHCTRHTPQLAEAVVAAQDVHLARDGGEGVKGEAVVTTLVSRALRASLRCN